MSPQQPDDDSAAAHQLDRSCRLLWRIAAVVVTALLVAPMMLQLCLLAAMLLVPVALFGGALLVALPLRMFLLAGGGGSVGPLLLPIGMLAVAAVQAAPVQTAMVVLFVPALLVLTPLLAPVVLVGLVMFERLDGGGMRTNDPNDDLMTE